MSFFGNFLFLLSAVHYFCVYVMQYHIHKESRHNLIILLPKHDLMFGSLLLQIRMLSVTFVRTTQGAETLGNLSHPLTSVQNFTEIVLGKPLRRLALNARGVAKQSDVMFGYLISDEFLVLVLISRSQIFNNSKCRLTATLIRTNLHDVVTGRNFKFIVISFVIKCGQRLVISSECSAHVCCSNSNITASSVYDNENKK